MLFFIMVIMVILKRKAQNIISQLHLQYLYSSGLICRRISILLSDNQLECTCAKHTAIIASTEIGLYGYHSQD